MATVQSLLTAEQFRLLADPRQLTELARGRVVAMDVPGFRHGKICGRIARIYGNAIEDHDLGHLVTNDAGVLTQRNPDTVRGADIAFYCYQRIPTGFDPVGYPDVAPELVFEVRSASDRWRNVLAKVAEYLQAGVNVVCVVDADSRTVNVYHSDRPTETLIGDDPLELPELFGDLRVAVSRFF